MQKPKTAMRQKLVFKMLKNIKFVLYYKYVGLCHAKRKGLKKCSIT